MSINADSIREASTAVSDSLRKLYGVLEEYRRTFAPPLAPVTLEPMEPPELVPQKEAQDLAAALGRLQTALDKADGAFYPVRQAFRDATPDPVVVDGLPADRSWHDLGLLVVNTIIAAGKKANRNGRWFREPLRKLLDESRVIAHWQHVQTGMEKELQRCRKRTGSGLSDIAALADHMDQWVALDIRAPGVSRAPMPGDLRAALDLIRHALPVDDILNTLTLDVVGVRLDQACAVVRRLRELGDAGSDSPVLRTAEDLRQAIKASGRQLPSAKTIHRWMEDAGVAAVLGRQAKRYPWSAARKVLRNHGYDV